MEPVDSEAKEYIREKQNKTDSLGKVEFYS